MFFRTSYNLLCQRVRAQDRALYECKQLASQDLGHVDLPNNSIYEVAFCMRLGRHSYLLYIAKAE